MTVTVADFYLQRNFSRYRPHGPCVGRMDHALFWHSVGNYDSQLVNAEDLTLIRGSWEINFVDAIKIISGLHGLVSCLIKIANDLDEEMSVEPREAYYRMKKHKNSGFQRTMRITKKFDKLKRTEKSGKSIGDILLENGHICNSPSGTCFSLGRPRPRTRTNFQIGSRYRSGHQVQYQ